MRAQRPQAGLVGHTRSGGRAGALGPGAHLTSERGQPFLGLLATAPLGAIGAVARRTTVRHGEERYQVPLRRWRQVARPASSSVPVSAAQRSSRTGVSGLLELQRQRCIACSNCGRRRARARRPPRRCTKNRLKWVMANRPTPHSVVAYCKRRGPPHPARRRRDPSPLRRRRTPRAGSSPTGPFGALALATGEVDVEGSAQQASIEPDRPSLPLPSAPAAWRSASSQPRQHRPPQPQQPQRVQAHPGDRPPGAAAPGTARRVARSRPAVRPAPVRPWGLVDVTLGAP